jgi:succinate dehydrogenase / fumarate reductase membrane anchor subunit
MTSLETPRHRVEGLGAAHSGSRHFWRQRVTAVALVPLAIWFGIAVLGLIGTNEAAVLTFLTRPINAILMASFVVILLYHMSLGLQDVIDDWVQSNGAKIFLLLVMRAATIGVGAASLLALAKIAIG